MLSQTAYTEVERLVNKFKHLSTAARKAYNEDNTRKDFIMPLFPRWNGTPRTASR